MPASQVLDVQQIHVGDPALATGRARQIVVMHENDVVVTGQLDVELDLAAPPLSGGAESGQGILRGVAAGPPMGGDSFDVGG